MSCRQCRYLDVPPDKLGRVTARKDKAYRCTVELPPPLVPVSVSKSYGWRWPPSRSAMSANDGEGCPFYDART
jgi:hypothetical protein